MNIMLVSVTERTREIGIRKSLGARTGSIMLQFLSESAIITLLGGVIGIILGVLGANVVCGFMGFTAAISPLTVLVTTLFSSGVGLFFGMLLFFNHGLNHKKADDPTPLQVQMRLYERDVNDAIVVDSAREGTSLDVD